MGFMDKLKNKMQMGRGRTKQQAGRTVGNPYLESKGKQERTAGGAKQVGEQVKDAAKSIKHAMKR
jgi:uncharacterized protein YjbJ (UPF0337 family)